MQHDLPDILIEGYSYFRTEFYPDVAEQLETLLVEGQKPWALTIGCSDSRVIPELVLGAEPGEFFVVRNVANAVPNFDPAAKSSASFWAAVEFAILYLHVPHIIVLGHDDCQGIKMLANRSPAAVPHDDAYFLHLWGDFMPQVEAKAATLAGDDPMARLVRANVLVQLERLKAHPAVANALSAGELSLIGLVYDMRGGIEYFDADAEAFKPLPVEASEHHHH